MVEVRNACMRKRVQAAQKSAGCPEICKLPRDLQAAQAAAALPMWSVWTLEGQGRCLIGIIGHDLILNGQIHSGL